MINILDPLPSPEKETTAVDNEISIDDNEDSHTQVKIDFE